MRRYHPLTSWRYVFAMKQIILAAALVAAHTSGASAQICERADAQSLVSSLKPIEQFKTMLRMTVVRTQTYGMASAGNPSATRQKLDVAIEEAAHRHAVEWQRNMVASWNTLPATELKGACAALNKHDNVAFMEFARTVGPLVKARNEPLLKTAATEVLGKLWPAH